MPNRLSRETSPYLLQHADNPVDWYPWGEEALTRARTEDKPILLSIGYSACHWCHVMAHESFEDLGVAETMNRLYVNIKVDREERPDLDQIYQLAHQMLAQRPGGWPLTVFLTPDQMPFFAGTYFPKEPRYGMIGFPQLLANVASIYRERKADIQRQNDALRGSFARMGAHQPTGKGLPAKACIDAALASSKSSFDPEHGGFGRAPKFPHPAELQFCLRRYAATGDTEARHIALHTLERMAQGGIYDQIGGGFSRYSVDAEWTIPHFEKMLYDNGPLLGLLADAWCVSGSSLYERVATCTAEWVMREMQDPAGGYYSSLDADSEHVEGKYYVWTPEEVRACLTDAEYAVAAAHWGLSDPPNFEGEHWHLRVNRPLAEVARHLSRNEQDCQSLIESARGKLYARREGRVRPGRDDKILTSWNALMISGMARASVAFDRPAWRHSAERAFEFVRTNLWQQGRLLATCRDGRAHLNAYLDDYAYLLTAAIDLLQARFSIDVLDFACALADAMLALFEDKDVGGFFFTSHDHETLIQRSKIGHDNATPAGNGIAAWALQRLAFVSGRMGYADAAQRTLACFAQAIEGQPGAHTSLMMALEECENPTRTVILRGSESELVAWRSVLAQRYMPTTIVLAIPSGTVGLPAVLDKPATSAAAAWICDGATCRAPVMTAQNLVDSL